MTAGYLVELDERDGKPVLVLNAMDKKWGEGIFSSHDEVVDLIESLIIMANRAWPNSKKSMQWAVAREEEN
ncbi:MAG: hypothetical protein AAF495_14460 [Pseudomonadota bacterium]